MRIAVIFFSFLLFSFSHSFYIVCHAEKETGIDPATMKAFSDPPLSPAGEERALKLKEILGSRNIKHIYSTNTLRTVSTAKPLKELYLGMPVNLYSSKPDSLDFFIGRLKSINKGDVLVVGHSNTVDDIVNKLCGEVKVPKDLPDSEYDNLYVVKKKGKKMLFENPV